MRRVVATVMVSCDGAKHRVGLCRDGSFIYYNHTAIHVRRYRLLAEIGAATPICLSFYKDRASELIVYPDISEVNKNRRFREAIRRVQLQRITLNLTRKSAATLKPVPVKQLRRSCFRKSKSAIWWSVDGRPRRRKVWEVSQ
jgi:hypothetical protein